MLAKLDHAQIHGNRPVTHLVLHQRPHLLGMDAAAAAEEAARKKAEEEAAHKAADEREPVAPAAGEETTGQVKHT